MEYKLAVREGKEDFDDSYFIRNEVFVKEQGFFNEFDEIDKTALHFLIYYRRKPIANARAFSDDEKKYYLGRVAVLKKYRERGIGRILMDFAEYEIKKRGGKEVFLSAQTRATEFYKKVGYEPYGEEYMEEDCPHISMKKAL